MRRLALLIMLSASLMACGGTPPPVANAPTPTPTPSEPENPSLDVAADESWAQDADRPTGRADARRAAQEYVTQHLAGWKVEGVSTFAYTGNLYLVAVDISKGKDRRTLDLAARLFFVEGREPYWKVDPMTEDLGRALAGWTYLENRKLRSKVADLEEENKKPHEQSAEDNNR